MKNKPTKEIIDKLNSGKREATNLMEILAVDMKLLLANVLPEFDCPPLPKELGITKKHKLIGVTLNKQFGFEIFENLLIPIEINIAMNYTKYN